MKLKCRFLANYYSIHKTLYIIHFVFLHNGILDDVGICLVILISIIR
jgi:hypothetical protein